MRKTAFSLLGVLLWVLATIPTRAMPLSLAAAATGDSASNHDAPLLVSSDSGDMIVVWRAVTTDGSEVIARKLNQQGKSLWHEGEVEVCTEPLPNVHFSAASDGRGGVIVAWEDSHKGRYDTDIYAARLDVDGRSLWQSGGIPLCTSVHQQQFPKSVSDKLGGAFVFWTDYRNGNADIFGCHVNEQGDILRRFEVCTQKDDQLDLATASSSPRFICLVWVDHRMQAPGIYAQLIDGDGKMRWSENGLPVCTGFFQQEAPAITTVNKNCFQVAWDDYRNRVAKVFVQAIDTDGVALLQPNGLPVTGADGPQYIPSLCGLDSIAGIVTWLQYGRGAGMFQETINLTGSIQVGKAYGIPKPSLAQFWPASVSDGHGGSVTAWLEYDVGRIEVFAQHTRADGRYEWGKSGRLLGAAKEKSHPQIVADRLNHTLNIAWAKEGPNGSVIVVTCVNEDGTVIWKKEF